MASLTNLMFVGNLQFNGRNYNHWKQRILTIFEYCHLDELVLGAKTRPTSDQAEQDKFEDRNREVVMLLKIFVIDDQLSQIPSGKSTTEIWKYLKELHEISDKSRAFFLKNQLFSIIMDERMSLQEHLTKIKDMCDQLEAIGQKMEEEDMVVITLKSLLLSSKHLKETLNITSTNLDLKFPELCTEAGPLETTVWQQCFYSLLRAGICYKILSTKHRQPSVFSAFLASTFYSILGWFYEAKYTI